MDPRREVKHCRELFTDQVAGSCFAVSGEAGLLATGLVDAMPCEDNGVELLLVWLGAFDDCVHCLNDVIGEVGFDAEQSKELQLSLSCIPGKSTIPRNSAFVGLDHSFAAFLDQKHQIRGADLGPEPFVVAEVGSRQG